MRLWRLWHRLFGWDYAQVDYFSLAGAKREFATTHRQRVYAAPNGRRYIYSIPKSKFPRRLMWLDECANAVPLTFVNQEEELSRFSDRVAKTLTE